MSAERKNAHSGNVLRAFQGLSFDAIFFRDGGFALRPSNGNERYQGGIWLYRWPDGQFIEAQAREQKLLEKIIDEKGVNS